MIDLTLDEDDAKIMKELKKSQSRKVATKESLLNAPKLLEGNVIGILEQEAVVKSLTESGTKSNEISKDNIIDLTVHDDANIMKEVAQSQIQREKMLVEKVTVDEPLLNTPDLFGILASDCSGATGSELLTNGPEKIDTSLTDETAREENLTAEKEPRTLIKTGKKQFGLGALTDESNAPKELEEIISAEINRTFDEVVCIKSGMKETQAATEPTENSDSDLDKENNLTQLSGKTDFIRKKAGKRIISDSEMSELGEDHLLETTGMKKNIENDPKVDNMDR